MPNIVGYEWVHQLPQRLVYFRLFERWPSTPPRGTDISAINLPDGYDFYIVSFHLEPVDLLWLQQQKVSGTIMVLHDGDHYELDLPGIHFLTFYYWHHQLAQMVEWFGVQPKTPPGYRYSAVCNRVTQSKLWITTKLLETARSDSMIVLNNEWIEEKNVHGWQSTGIDKLDQLMTKYRDRYLPNKIQFDSFENSRDNHQSHTANPWQTLVQDAAIVFTNESFHYSLMQENGHDYLYPGPFITEKTLKCLLGATAFVPVGQFATYASLRRLGFDFDYDFDISWDQDPGNLTRMSSIIDLIDDLNQRGAKQIYQQTLPSSLHNQNHIVSGEFFKRCQQSNTCTIEQIHQLIR